MRLDSTRPTDHAADTAPRWSLLRVSAWERIALAGLVSGGLWLAVLWSTAS